MLRRGKAALLLALLLAIAGAGGLLFHQRDRIERSLAKLKGLASRAEADPVPDARAVLRCDLPGRAISPLIFGVSGGGPRELGATADRLGGNDMTRYNWELGDAWNTGADWYFRNVRLGYSYKTFLGRGLERGQALALTVPIIGWVAKDHSSYSFSVEAFGAQQSVDPENSDIGNGRRLDGAPITPGPPERTSVRAPPESIRRWVEAIRRDDAVRGKRSVSEYILDNEPGLWNETHRDVHPDPVSYDELLERTIEYGRAVRAADPEALIAGPAAWGYWEYFYSALDARKGFGAKPDRLAHGDVPLLAYYLRKLREHERRTGERILDVLDVHYYPQARGVFAAGGGGASDDASAALRIRATRSLWDKDYVDESWVSDTVMLLPRMQKLILDEYPGRRLSIGEWNFGGESHISGGLAVAEALGRFAQYGVYSAFYWTVPKEHSPAYWGFRAYRNYDGRGASFLSEYVESEAPDQLSIFASRDAGRKQLVLVILNLNAAVPRSLTLDTSRCGRAASIRHFAYDASSTSLATRTVSPNPGPKLELLPYSLSVAEIRLD